MNIYKNGVYEETVLVDVLTTEQGSSKTALGKTGPLSKPSLDIINITVTKSVAKITVNNHPYDAGDVVEISGVEESNLSSIYNKNHTITTRVDSNSFNIQVPSNSQIPSLTNVKVKKGLIEDFYGDLTEFKIYGKSLTNNDINLIYKGVEPDDINLLVADRELWQTGIVGSRPKSVNRTFGNVSKPYKLKFIFHRNKNGDVKMLQRIFFGFDGAGKPILSTNETPLDKNRLNESARLSVVHLPYKNKNTAWKCNGELAHNGELITYVDVEYDDHVSSPFIHTYHPIMIT